VDRGIPSLAIKKSPAHRAAATNDCNLLWRYW
jgi:hypothetical protein